MTSALIRPAAPWDGVTSRGELSYAQIESLMWEMEAARAQYVDETLDAAKFLGGVAKAAGWLTLEKRADLVTADFACRNGDLGTATAIAQEVGTWAERCGETYLQARSAFVLSTVAFAIGDTATTLVEGVHCVRLLEENAPLGIRIDHMLMAAVGAGAGTPEGDRWYAEVLDLALAGHDISAALVIHNNKAWHHYTVGERPEAMQHVIEMLLLSRRFAKPLKAVMLDTIARVQVLHEDFEAALHTLAPVLEEDSQIELGEPTARADCLIAAAAIHRRQENFAEAAALLDLAHHEAARGDLLASQAQVHEERALWHAAQGDFAQAFSSYVQFHALASRARSEEAQRHAHLVEAAYEVEQASRDVRRFRELAYHDPLTGLPNRRFLDEELFRMCGIAHRDGTAMSAAIVDADHFKRINDELSHERGDEVLQILGRLLEQSAGQPAVVGRLGGEEFALLLPHLGPSQVVQVCEQVCAAVREHDWSPVTGAIPVTVSIGVSTATTGSTSPGILLAGADRNLYTAKRNGRDCVVGDRGIEAAEHRPAAESGRVPGREREDANQRAVCHAPYRRPRAGAPG